MKYTLPALTLAISAALSGCATPHSSAVSQPVVDSPVPNVAQPLQRQLAEGLYEMALSPQGDALYVASAEGFKNVQGGAVYTLDPHTLNTIGLTHTDLKNFALQLSAEGKPFNQWSTTCEHRHRHRQGKKPPAVQRAQ